MSPISLLWVRLVLYAGLVLLLVGSLKACHDSLVGKGVQQGTNAERARWLERDRQAAAAAATETARRLKAQEESNRESRKFIEQAQDAAVADRGSRERMHSDLAAATAARRSADPAAVEQCQAAEAAADLYLDLFGRADARASELATYADQAHGAGLGCEREHDALRPAP